MHGMSSPFLKKRFSLVIVFCSLFIAVGLTLATWNINFWPTDTEVYYLDAARQLPQLKFVSQMHASLDEERVRWLHGKEGFVVAAAIAQQIMGDTQTLRPFILVDVIAVFLSSILVFLILRFYWGEIAATIGYFFFTTSFWPYVYILFAKHQPLGLCLFLLSVFCLNKASGNKWGRLYYLASGLSLGFALFTSTVSTLYLLYYIAAFLYAETTQQQSPQLKFLHPRLAAATGLIIALLFFTFPNIVYNIKSFLEYVDISGKFNHFYYNQPVLQQWFPAGTSLRNVRGGWEWIFKYFFLIMPVLFPVFLFCHGYLVWQGLRLKENKRSYFLNTGLIVLLSWSAPILAEIKGVAQYGANYFPAIVGVLMLVGYTTQVFLKFYGRVPKLKMTWAAIGLGVLVLHMGVNAVTFAEDIYPTRMVTTFLSRKIDELGLKKLYTYRYHPQRSYMTDYLNPELLKRLQFVAINYVYEPLEGVVLLPPVTGNSIYVAAHSDYTDFDQDFFLNELIRRGNLPGYAIASFKTMAASRIWPHEEEILTYRYLNLNQFSPEIVEKGKVWLLDAAKLKRDMKRNMPPAEDLKLVTQEIRNIGTKRQVYMYKGYRIKVDRPVQLNKLRTRIYSVGHPTDQLLAYVYKVDSKQELWVPYSEHFVTRPVAGTTIADNPAGQEVIFEFPKSLLLYPGLYNFVIYRNGPPNDQGFYRIYKNNFMVLEK